MKKNIIILASVVFMITTFITNVFGQSEQPSGKVSGVFFMDYYFNAVRDTGFKDLSNTVIKGDEKVNGFQVRRIYFNYDYKFNSKLSSKFRLESDEANFTSNLAGNKANKFGMFVKDAFIKWNYFGSHDLIFGIQGTPGFEISESGWGNRYIEKTIMDVRGIHPSRDLGLSLRGKIDSAGIFKYWLMFANGSASVPENDEYKRYAFNLAIAPIKNLIITLVGDYQTKKPIDDAFNANKKLNNEVLTTAFFVGYKKKDKYALGFETYYRQVQNGYKLANSYDDLTGMGISFFSTVYVNKNLNIFARYDNFEPNMHKDAKGDTRNLIITGLGYKPADNFIVSPNVYIETYEKIGDRKIKTAVTPRITLSWAF